MRKTERPNTFNLCGSSRTVQHVENMLCNLDESVRVKCACIIFNDSDEATRNRFIKNLVDLYDYAPENFEPEVEQVRVALIQLGYKASDARLRSISNEPIRKWRMASGPKRTFAKN